MKANSTSDLGIFACLCHKEVFVSPRLGTKPLEDSLPSQAKISEELCPGGESTDSQENMEERFVV